MKFEVFKRYIKIKREYTGLNGLRDGLKNFLSAEPELLYEINFRISKNMEKFAIVYCGSNNPYELRGKKIALELGMQAMEKYLSKEPYGTNSCSTYSILQNLTDSWKKQISKECRNKSLSDFDPFFMAIAGDSNKVLFVQYGSGYFATQTDNKRTIYSLYQNKNYSVTGFTGKSRLYFKELPDMPHTNNIPRAAVMIGPYNFRNPTMEKKVTEMFWEFAEKTEVEHYIDRNEGRAFCIEPIEEMVNSQIYQNNFPFGVAGYWIINEARNPGYTNMPQTQSYPHPKEPSLNYTHSAPQISPRNYPPQNPQDYGQRPAFPTKSGSLFHKQQKQKQQAQYLQQLAEIKQDLQIKEQKLIQLQQMQKDILKQQENLATEHEKTLKWKESQQKYLESKRMLNQCPQD